MKGPFPLIGGEAGTKQQKTVARTTVGKNADKFVLRMPQGMRDAIRVVAMRNFRSMNSEMVFMLEQALKDEI